MTGLDTGSLGVCKVYSNFIFQISGYTTIRFFDLQGVVLGIHLDLIL